MVKVTNPIYPLDLLFLADSSMTVYTESMEAAMKHLADTRFLRLSFKIPRFDPTDYRELVISACEEICKKHPSGIKYIYEFREYNHVFSGINLIGYSRYQAIDIDRKMRTLQNEKVVRTFEKYTDHLSTMYKESKNIPILVVANNIRSFMKPGTANMILRSICHGGGLVMDYTVYNSESSNIEITCESLRDD